ncbi:HDOD domain-containing protein [Blastopirellula sp. JC732]|uniref:HDOD domain-containing protein n=1 Tax=Blastopirellula sediminis TaxID=2894196 RepID=A0A9X1MQ20_9BACT|nr:HDOD domain-containing protein [Blastopirellula sediminis]MCC9606340.1 HDOD domain-containing protein [Blastopirellula sediminis]MCC9630362.1 HDOD domain-containing protein [Blastopirellula sediminis]
MTARPAAEAGYIQQFVERASSLYSLPAVAMEVLELTGRPSIDAAQVKSCIERDPALTIKILRAVNSPLFGLSRQVSDLHQALALLGMKPLKLLVLGFSLPREMLDGVEADSLSRYWSVALTKAVAAREIAEYLGYRNGDEAFIAGLLADIGMLVLMQDLGAPYAQFIRKAEEEAASLLEMEVGTLGFDHIILSSRLLTHWKLPDSVIDSIAAIKPLPLTAPLELANLSETARTLVLADRLADILVGKRLAALPAWVEAIAKYVPSDKTDFENLAVRIEEKVKQLAAVMRVRIDEKASYVDAMLTAYARLAEVASEAALDVARRDPEELELQTAWEEAKELTSAMQSFRQRPLTAAAPEKPSTLKSSPAVATIETAKASPKDVALDKASVARLDFDVQRCRQMREPISVLQLTIDRYDDLLLHAGPDEAIQTWRLLEKAVGAIIGDAGSCFASADAVLMVVLPMQDRMQAVETARRLVAGIRTWSLARAESGRFSPLTISVGAAAIALPPKNFPSGELADAATRCMEVARRSGGDSVKSIEIL